MTTSTVNKAVASALTAVMLVIGAGCGVQQQSAPAAVNWEERYPGYKTDFYEAVNKAQFDEWEIPDSDPSIGHFIALDRENNQRLLKLMEDAAQSAGTTDDSDTAVVGALWATGNDIEARNAGGFGNAQRFIDAVDEAQTTRDVIKAAIDFDRMYGYYSFFGMSLAPDSADASRKVHYLGPTDLGLTKEEWHSSIEETKTRVKLYEELMAQLWVESGASAADAEAKVSSVTKAMRDLSGSALDQADMYNAEKTYNVHTMADLEAVYGGAVPMDHVYKAYGVSPEDKVVVKDEGLWKATAKFLHEADLQLVKDYLKTCLFSDLGTINTHDAFLKVSENHRKRLGMEEAKPFDQNLAAQVNNWAPFQCGRLYANAYYDPKVEADIQSMVDDFLDVYATRINGLEWMTASTKKEALAKLDAMTARIGVPDVWPQDRYGIEVKTPEEGGLYIDNILAVLQADREYEFATKDEPVDGTLWEDPPQTINAFYDLSGNNITLLAGVLNSPFYSGDATEEENLGGIGMIIAHEITHAFDSSGSQYDSNGNLRNWWAQDDAKKFEELGQSVVEYYSAQSVRGMQVDGQLTLGENIADLGAMACVSAVAKQRGLDLRKVYAAYANLWAEEVRDEYLANLVTTDSHSPGKVRVNAVLSATDDFYDAFGITEQDAMYVAPEDRPRIW